ncbi:glutathione S-transferase family protein [Ruegeria sp. 1NDH52C]|uniref:Glutathione S-transferase family protein n=1 Tax=Ruegeria alba TaxID=2916756 RepID=A0ABS9NV54_9RHOB|nr:glutathione S-transferase family protein [Ruegeria alba]MCG6558105.1 glutathione S-transferase family protein [Ruegeria alba]
MLTLMMFPKAFGLYSASPFCVKAAYLMQLAGQPWRRQDLNDPRQMPHRKLPVLRTPERLVPDSEGIRAWLEAQGADFDRGLSDAQRAHACALVHMAEDHLYPFLVLDRWENDAVWLVIRETFFADIPRLLRKPVTKRIRAQVLRGLDFQGAARFSDVERRDRVERSLEALTALLWQKPYLFGEYPTTADLSVAPMLAAMRATPVATPLQRRIAEDRILSEYIDRMDETLLLT